VDGDGLINKSELKIAIEHLTGSELEPAEVTKKNLFTKDIIIYTAFAIKHLTSSKLRPAEVTKKLLFTKDIIIYTAFCVNVKAFDCLPTPTYRGFYNGT
jgi:hypothetical protein